MLWMLHWAFCDLCGREEVPASQACRRIGRCAYECPLSACNPWNHEVDHPSEVMEEDVAWVGMGIFGLVVVVDVLIIGWAPRGPWNDVSFSLGVLGIIGLAALYISWYRWRFKQKGVVPWMRLWKDARTSGVNVTIIGVVVMLSTWSLYASSSLPPAGGLILNLIGALMILQGAYAILSSGYLSD